MHVQCGFMSVYPRHTLGSLENNMETYLDNILYAFGDLRLMFNVYIYFYYKQCWNNTKECSERTAMENKHVTLL